MSETQTEPVDAMVTFSAAVRDFLVQGGAACRSAASSPAAWAALLSSAAQLALPPPVTRVLFQRAVAAAGAAPGADTALWRPFVDFELAALAEARGTLQAVLDAAEEDEDDDSDDEDADDDEAALAPKEAGEADDEAATKRHLRAAASALAGVREAVDRARAVFLTRFLLPAADGAELLSSYVAFEATEVEGPRPLSDADTAAGLRLAALASAGATARRASRAAIASAVAVVAEEGATSLDAANGVPPAVCAAVAAWEALLADEAAGAFEKSPAFKKEEAGPRGADKRACSAAAAIWGTGRSLRLYGALSEALGWAARLPCLSGAALYGAAPAPLPSSSSAATQDPRCIVARWWTQLLATASDAFRFAPYLVLDAAARAAASNPHASSSWTALVAALVGVVEAGAGITAAAAVQTEAADASTASSSSSSSSPLPPARLTVQGVAGSLFRLTPPLPTAFSATTAASPALAALPQAAPGVLIGLVSALDGAALIPAAGASPAAAAAAGEEGAAAPPSLDLYSAEWLAAAVAGDNNSSSLSADAAGVEAGLAVGRHLTARAAAALATAVLGGGLATPLPGGSDYLSVAQAGLTAARRLLGLEASPLTGGALPSPGSSGSSGGGGGGILTPAEAGAVASARRRAGAAAAALHRLYPTWRGARQAILLAWAAAEWEWVARLDVSSGTAAALALSDAALALAGTAEGEAATPAEAALLSDPGALIAAGGGAGGGSGGGNSSGAGENEDEGGGGGDAAAAPGAAPVRRPRNGLPRVVDPSAALAAYTEAITRARGAGAHGAARAWAAEIFHRLARAATAHVAGARAAAAAAGAAWVALEDAIGPVFESSRAAAVTRGTLARLPVEDAEAAVGAFSEAAAAVVAAASAASVEHSSISVTGKRSREEDESAAAAAFSSVEADGAVEAPAAKRPRVEDEEAGSGAAGEDNEDAPQQPHGASAMSLSALFGGGGSSSGGGSGLSSLFAAPGPKGGKGARQAPAAPKEQAAAPAMEVEAPAAPVPAFAPHAPAVHLPRADRPPPGSTTVRHRVRLDLGGGGEGGVAAATAAAEEQPPPRVHQRVRAWEERPPAASSSSSPPQPPHSGHASRFRPNDTGDAFKKLFPGGMPAAEGAATSTEGGPSDDVAAPAPGQSTSVFVRGIPPAPVPTVADVASVFAAFGHVTDVVLYLDPHSGTPRGTGVVTFATPAAAAAAVRERRGKAVLQGSQLAVFPYDAERPKAASAAAAAAKAVSVTGTAADGGSVAAVAPPPPLDAAAAATTHTTAEAPAPPAPKPRPTFFKPRALAVAAAPAPAAPQ